MPVNISHVDGAALFRHKHDLEPYLADALGVHTTGHAWMNTSDLALRFQLPSFQELPEAECLSYQWDIPRIEQLITEVVVKVQGYIPLPDLTVTIVPARPFPWFREFGLPESQWSNAFTNGPGKLVVAIPAGPDLDYLANLVAHECHHGCPANPIYQLTLDRFTLADWLKMEGTAEYFAHLLYQQDQWWWAAFPADYEADYRQLIEPHLNTADDAVKSPLAFGSKARGIPTFAGYTFGYRAVANYMRRFPATTVADLFHVGPMALLQATASRSN